MLAVRNTMGNKRRSRRSEGMTRERALVMTLLLVVLFAAALLGVRFLGEWLEPEPMDVRGSLEGRFEPTLMLEHNGQTYAHQELNYTTLLFIGVDKSSLGSSNVRGGGQADFLLLMTIDRENKEVDLLQLDRDTITAVQVYGVFGNPAGSRDMQICLSYAFGTDPQKGCANTVRAVSDFLGGIPIDGYVALDLDGMSILNDALGGVTVTLTEDFSDLDPAMKAGETIRLQGKQAEYFLRTRKTVGDGTNAQRMNRQEVFIRNAATLLNERMSADANFVGTLMNLLRDHLVTGCDDVWLINQAYTALKYTRTEPARIAGEHCIGSDGFVEFHPDRDALMDYIVSTFCE